MVVYERPPNFYPLYVWVPFRLTWMVEEIMTAILPRRQYCEGLTRNDEIRLADAIYIYKYIICHSAICPI